MLSAISAGIPSGIPEPKPTATGTPPTGLPSASTTKTSSLGSTWMDRVTSSAPSAATLPAPNLSSSCAVRRSSPAGRSKVAIPF
jgi:hypothetical protein